jgi:glycosyltransferase involved in cell wall biosynthesis
MKPRVVYWNNIPSPYMVDRFNVLNDRGHLEFEAWFSARTKQGRSWHIDEDSWEFPFRYLPRVGYRRFSFALATPLLRGRGPDLLVTLHSNLAFLLGWQLARRRGSRTAFWVLATYDAWIKRRIWKEMAKSKIFPKADAVLVPGDDARAFAHRYGAPEERIHHVSQVINVAHFENEGKLSPVQRMNLRRELGLSGVTFVYVGRLWLGKGLTYLIDAFVGLQRLNVDTCLLIVGDGPDEALLRERCAKHGLRNVIFSGFQHAHELPALYAAADVFVFPTLGDPFGLVVLEAMACGLPVIATSASGEIRDRVHEGVNGFIVEPAASDQLLDRMSLLAHDGALRRRMGNASQERAKGGTLELWAQEFELAVERILAMPPVKGFPSNRSGPRFGPAKGSAE